MQQLADISMFMQLQSACPSSVLYVTIENGEYRPTVGTTLLKIAGALPYLMGKTGYFLHSLINGGLKRVAFEGPDGMLSQIHDNLTGWVTPLWDSYKDKLRASIPLVSPMEFSTYVNNLQQAYVLYTSQQMNGSALGQFDAARLMESIHKDFRKRNDYIKNHFIGKSGAGSITMPSFDL